MAVEGPRALSTRANRGSQLLCAWSGPAFVLVFLIGLLVAGFVPPPAPALGANRIAHEILDSRDRIRVGLILALASVGLYAYFSAGLSVQLKRIEGQHSPMTYAQLGLGVLAVLLVIFPLMWLLTAAYRPSRSADLVHLLSDMAWFPFVGAWMTVVFQWLATAVAIFQDDREDPVFPRWAGYFNLWVAAQSLPSTLLFFVHDGPFAWDGIFSFWFALTAFAGWILVMAALMIRAANRQARVRPL